MPSFLEQLRLRNIFNPILPGNDLPQQGGITGNMYGGQVGPNPAGDIFNTPGVPQFSAGEIFAPEPDKFMNLGAASAGVAPSVAPSPAQTIEDRMQEYYRPETAASEAYNQAISAYPQYEKPGFWRAMAGALTAFGPGGHQLGMQIANWNNLQRMQEWKDKIGPLQRAADLERYENVNRRGLAYQTVTAQQAAEKQAEVERHNLATEKDKARRTEIYNAKNQGFKVVTKGDTIKLVNPMTGEMKDTGYSTGILSDVDRLALEQENALERITTQQGGKEALAWSDPYEVTTPEGTKKYYQTSKATGETREVEFPGTATKIGAPGKTTASNVALDAIRMKTQETLDALNEIVDEKGKLTGDAQWAVGGSRLAQLHRIPGSSAKAGDAAINRVKSLLIVDLIGEMKAQSKTGATGFGQLNMKELAVLENAASKLDPGLPEETFEAEVKRIREKLNKVLLDTPTGTAPTAPTTSIPTTPTPSNPDVPISAAPTVTTPTTTKPSARDLINKYSTAPTMNAPAMTTPPPMQPITSHSPSLPPLPPMQPMTSTRTPPAPPVGSVVDIRRMAPNPYARVPAGAQTAPNTGGLSTTNQLPTGVQQDKQAQAIAILRQNGRPVTPENIQAVVMQLMQIEANAGAE